MARYLTRQGLFSHDDALSWLDPQLRHLPPPEELPDMEAALPRIIAAIREQELIAVYGDYDVDGLTATYVLSDFLERCGARVVSYIPDRLQTGYGLHSECIRELFARGVRLLVTVDCGVSNREQVEEAKRLGMDVIVTDHHLLPDDEPLVPALINPKKLRQDHPLFNLAGVGVAFYLVVALRSRLRDAGHYRLVEEPNLRRYMDLIALGTVADLMPLQGVNRILVRHGLHELSHGARHATDALRRVIGHREGTLTPWDIHFRFAPRINAASRMGRQDIVMQWLSSGSAEEASALALQMEQLNKQRAALEAKTFNDAVDFIGENRSLRDAKALVLAMKDQHPGILGIVAARLVERYGKPAVLLTWKGEYWEGSGRSIEGFHLYHALESCRAHLHRFGGHAMAVGLKLADEALGPFRERLEAYAATNSDEQTGEAKLKLHASLPLSQISEKTLSWMDRMGPFGQGCPEPVFWAESLEVHSYEVLQQQHLRLTIGQNGKRFPAIAFRLAPFLPHRVDRLEACAFVPMRQSWRGQTTIQLRVLDFKAPQDGVA